MVILALAPLLIMAAQGLHCARQAVIELVYRNLQSVLDERSAFVRHWLMERERDLSMAAATPCGLPDCTGILDHMDPEHMPAVENALNPARSMPALYESIAVYNAAGVRMAHIGGATHAAPESLLDARLRTRLAATNRLVVSPTHPHADGQFGLHMGYPLLASDGRHEGAIVVNVVVAHTLDAILHDRTRLGDTASIYLLASDGRYVSVPPGGPGASNAEATVPPAMLRNETGRVHAYVGISGKPVLGVAAPLPAFDWIIVAEIDEAEALGWLAVLRMRAMVTGLLVLVGVMGLATRYSKKLTDPLRALALTARRIATGASRERIAGLHGREAREVAAAFNDMLDAMDEAQRKLVQSASLAAIGELSSSIVHEMRNPLSSVKMNLKALREKVRGDPTYGELAEIASGQVDRLEHMLTDLLQYGKPLELDRKALQFGELVNEVTAALAHHVHAGGVELSVEDRTRGRRFVADKEQLVRAVTNLLDNAMRASPRGSTVRVVGELAGDGANAAVAIAVRDAGAGIPERAQGSLFKPFFTTRGDGTGLGLANVRKIAELHGGTVDAENLPGGGAQFTLTLPLGGSEA